MTQANVAPGFALMAAIQHSWMARRLTWQGFWLVVVIHCADNATGLLIQALAGEG